MDPELRVHLATAGILGGGIGVALLLWAFPKLLILLFLLLLASLAYGGLYLLLAAHMDPLEEPGERAGTTACSEPGMSCESSTVVPSPSPTGNGRHALPPTAPSSESKP